MTRLIVVVVLSLAFVSFVAGQVADCAIAPTDPQDRRNNTSNLRIATFNVEWLFAGDDGKSGRTKPEAEEHLELVADAIAKFSPDVISLQEVQDCNMLKRLVESLERRNINGLKPYMIKGTDTATGQNVGFLTRVDPVGNVWRTAARASYPVPGTTCGSTASGTYGVSKHYVAPFIIGGVKVAMLGQHYLAFPTDKLRCVEREAQCSVMRALINAELEKGQQIISFGDMNDYSDDVMDSANDVPISRVIRIVRDGVIPGTEFTGFLGEPSNETISLAPNDISLYEPSQIPPQAQRYTSAYDKTKVSMIDHILLSTPLANAITQVVFDHNYPRETVSDHWPVWIDIAWPPQV